MVIKGKGQGELLLQQIYIVTLEVVYDHVGKTGNDIVNSETM